MTHFFEKVPSRQSASGLLQLPWETRRLILQFLLTHDELLHPHSLLSGYSVTQVEFLSQVKSVFAVCQQLHGEATEVFLDENTFQITVESCHECEMTIRLMQYRRDYHSQLWLAVDIKNQNPEWLKCNFLRLIDRRLSKA